jgi:hypothetical protein
VSDPLGTTEAIRRHVTFKHAAGEMTDAVAQRMLEALDRGDNPRYAALLEQASFPPPPPVVFHTAPAAERAAIQRGGLEAQVPGKAWVHDLDAASLAFEATQPKGVYVGAEPDTRGLWSHWAAWDVWEIRLGDLPWRHDRMNPGCWSIDVDVPAALLRLVGTFPGGKQ